MTSAPACVNQYVMRPDAYLKGVINVREAFGGWLLGRLRKSNAVIEMSWELWPKLQPLGRCLGATCIVNIRVFDGPETLFDWNFGHCSVKPDPRVAPELNEILKLLSHKEMSTVPDRREHYDQRTIQNPEGPGPRRQEVPRGPRYKHGRNRGLRGRPNVRGFPAHGRSRAPAH